MSFFRAPDSSGRAPPPPPPVRSFSAPLAPANSPAAAALLAPKSSVLVTQPLTTAAATTSTTTTTTTTTTAPTHALNLASRDAANVKLAASLGIPLSALVSRAFTMPASATGVASVPAPCALSKATRAHETSLGLEQAHAEADRAWTKEEKARREYLDALLDLKVKTAFAELADQRVGEVKRRKINLARDA